jgi:hypothetical protein
MPACSQKRISDKRSPELVLSQDSGKTFIIFLGLKPRKSARTGGGYSIYRDV